MTDTGQVPGEGHPDNAGMVDQQGVPAPVPPMPPLPPMPPAGYAFQDLVDDPAEDEELLLMPSGHGQGGAWSDPQVVPQAPVFPGEFPTEQGYTEYPQPQAVGYPEQGHLGFPEPGFAMPGAQPVPGQEPVPGQQVVPGQPMPGQSPAGRPVQDPSLAGRPLPGQPHGFPDGTFPDGTFPDPAAPEGFADPAAYSAGAHETGGRDSGSLDLGGLVVPPAAAAAAGQMPLAAPVAPSRRPLHMGPPVPEATGGVVRSLADRGPAAAPAPGMAPPVPAGPAVAVPTGAPAVAVPTGAPAVAVVPAPVAEAAPEAAGPDAAAAGGATAPETAPETPPGAEPLGAAEPSAAAAVPGAPEPVVVAGAGVVPGVPAAGPEYLDVPGAEAVVAPVAPVAPQLGEVPPQAGAPWAAEPAGAGAEQVAPAEGLPVNEGQAAAEVQPVADGQPAAAVDGPAVVEGLPVAEVPAAAAEGAPVGEVQAVAEAAAAPEAVPAAPEAVEAPETVAGEAAAGPEGVTAPEGAPAPAAEAAPAAEGTPGTPEPVTAAAQAPEGAENPAEQAVEAPVVVLAEVPPAEPVVQAADAPAVTVTPDAPTDPAAPADVVPAEPAPDSAEAAEPVAADAEPATGDPADPAPVDGEAAAEVPAEPQPSAGEPAPGYADAEREAVLRVMRERRDIRNGFRTDPIPHEVLLRVLEAAHHAPSVGHSQPWDFVVIRSAETRRTMHELAQRQREAYAKSLPKGRAKQFKELKIEAILDTPVNIVVTADPTRGGRHTLGRHTQPQMAPYSSALAVENLWLAARAEGLGVGWVSFFDEREMVRALGLPEHLEVVAYLCVGYVDEFPEEPELMQAGWAQRRPLAWVVHEETYGRRALPGEAPHDLLSDTVASIRPLDAKALGEAWERQKRMTKPAGALGMLEIISAQLAGLSRVCPPPIPEPAAVAIFAGDHGVHAQGVTPWPQEVTTQMVANFLGGGAVCNAFANQVGAEVCVVDVGVKGDLPATPGLLPRKVRPGTDDLSAGPAMSREDAVAAIEVGIETARDLVAAGNKALLTGEMGIANTTVSAALISVFTGVDPAEVTGRGTGINDETHARKVDVVRRALELHQPDVNDPIGVLAAIGGLEHAAIVGLILGGASLRTPVILDGVSAGAAALVARAIAPEALSACIAGHRSAEPGHVAALNKLGLRPLVDLDLRLGEGTGALLALPLVQSAARAMHEVATFDSAGVTEK
ncbi:nicotinate-nucleotide--dimethylbenzimidazole phosphoribosyltransferase [Streptomyces sp. NPDC058157]|uniref:nicotinate-nucleotide--dimethylbenzimidazole phosphoribosyltransferase n=1 Tax=Streptomyces sp. NPDC058157 TaxID=3346360 RepID=UPI0036F15180